MPICRITQTIATPDKQAVAPARAAASGRISCLRQPPTRRKASVAYFQEIYIPPNRRKLLFESDLHQR